jgi:Tfp pilus assembly protein PilO
MKFQDLKDKQKLMVIIGFAVVTLGGAIFLLMQTLLKNIKINTSQISTTEMSIMQVKRAQDDINKFEAEYKSVQETLDQINQKLPKGKELPELLSTLAKLAATFPNKDYISLTPGQIDDLGKYYRLPFTINIKCRYTELLTYLGKLEGLPRLIKIENMQITPYADPETLGVSLQLSVYYLKAEQPKTEQPKATQSQPGQNKR